VNGVPVTAWEQVPKLVAAGMSDGQILIDVQRGADRRALTVVPESGKIMVRSQMEQQTTSIGQALPAAFGMPVVIVARTAAQVRTWLARRQAAELSGPLGVARMVGPGSRWTFTLELLTLAVGMAWPLVMPLELVVGPRRRRRPASA
jgi:hypothetical protein